MPAEQDTSLRRGRRSRGPISWGLRAAVSVVRPSSRTLWREHFAGVQHIPVAGPAIVVMNHVSILDPMLFASFIWDAGRVPRFLLKESLAKAPVVGLIVASAGQIPVNRGRAGARESLVAGRAALEAGEVLCVYPEGTVTRDPAWWPMQAKTGAARLAAACPDVPVVPVAQWGPQLSLDYHTGRRDVFPRKDAFVTAGPPLDLGPARTHTDPVTTRETTLQMMRAIRALLAQIRHEVPPEEFFVPSWTPDRSDPAR